MTDGDRPRFAAEMLRLSAVFREPLDEVQVAEYFSALQDCSLPELHEAVSVVIKNVRFFPRPVELIEIVVEHRQAAAETAERERQARRMLEAPPPSDEERAESLRMIHDTIARLSDKMRWPKAADGRR